MKKQTTGKILFLCLIGLSLSACAELIAILGVLSWGAPMPLVRAKLGDPEWSGKDDQGFDVDRFELVQARGSKATVTVTYDAQHRVIKVEDEQGNELPLQGIARDERVAAPHRMDRPDRG